MTAIPAEMRTAAGGPPDAHRLAAAGVEERLAQLATSAHGLGRAEAAARLQQSGPNEPVPPQRRHPLRALLANFTHTLALLLWFAAGLGFAAGAPQLGAAIIAVIAVNGIFAYLQEHHAEQLVGALMRRVAVQTRVLRDDAEQALPAADLVPGDVVRLAAGDIVPADCVLLAADDLMLDLSMITGESTPVERVADVMLVSARSRLPELASIAPAGAAVISGSAEAAVFATGPASTMGQVASLVESVDRGHSLLERQIAGLSRVTAVIAVLAGAATLALAAGSSDTGFIAALTFATGVIVALVPEGLLPTLSVSLAIGASRMATRGAAVRRLSAVEVIGAVTVICTDKTGTLTQNSLSVLGFIANDHDPALAERAVHAAVLCNDARFMDGAVEGDPMDAALLRWAIEQGADPTALRERYRRVADQPFEAYRRSMSVTCDEDGRRVTFIKGAPEAVRALAGDPQLSPRLVRAIEDATGRGERVLLVAAGPAGASPAVLGLLRLHDPPRPEVPESIAACREAGVRVVMLTGDHPATARAVGEMVGLGGDELPVIEGWALDGMADSELAAILRGNAIFARIDPQQKLRIVTLLKRLGEVVVVTGDGINDAPALRAADVGVAMGLRGTEVAKQAADIVLADDNFATIVAAIEEGRAIKANIRRFVSYVFTSNVAELAPFLAYVFLPVPLPLAIMQVLAIDLGTDLLPALALGAEPPSAALMQSPPEPPNRPLLTRALALKTFLFFGGVEALLGLAGFFGYYLAEGWRPFESLAPFADAAVPAATVTFLAIVGGQVGCLFAERDGPLLARLSLRGNGWMVTGLVTELALAVALVYVPGINDVFSMTTVPFGWLLVVPAGAAIFLLADLVRRWTARRATDAHLHGAAAGRRGGKRQPA